PPAARLARPRRAHWAPMPLVLRPPAEPAHAQRRHVRAPAAVHQPWRPMLTGARDMEQVRLRARRNRRAAVDVTPIDGILRASRRAGGGVGRRCAARGADASSRAGARVGVGAAAVRWHVVRLLLVVAAACGPSPAELQKAKGLAYQTELARVWDACDDEL